MNKKYITILILCCLIISGICYYVYDKTNLSIESILPELKKIGTISDNPNKIKLLTTTDNNIEIEKLETYEKRFIIVTLNTGCKNIDTNDIAFKKFNNDWYSLSPSNSLISITDSYTTINNQGKTVIIYKIKDKINGTKITNDDSSKKFSNLNEEIIKANNFISWQMDHGGWDKGVDEQAKKAWNKNVKKNQYSDWFGENGEILGTIDNNATYTQMQHIAAVYREIPEKKYKESVLKGLEFIFKLQYESGGFAQVYPRRGNYSDYVTFNDNAMINVLIMLEKMKKHEYPFDSDIIPKNYMKKIENSINKGIDFILKSQIKQNDKLTAWCAQHSPTTYEPLWGRSYEPPSINAYESVEIIKFLMNQKQTPEIKNAIIHAIKWLKDSKVKNMKYIENDPNGIYFIQYKGSNLWYRFYDIKTNLPIFCDRDGIPKNNIAEISEERRNGYNWSGKYPEKFINIYEQFGYYPGKIEATIVKTNSVSIDNKTFKKESTKYVDSQIIKIK